MARRHALDGARIPSRLASIVAALGGLAPSVVRSAAAAVFVAIAVLSAFETAPRTWERLTRERLAYDDLSLRQRVHAPGDVIPLPMDVYDFYRDRLRRGDRYYMQVIEGGFGTADFPTTVRTLGNFYLLPALMVRRPEEADVILSWGVDPNELGLSYRRMERAEANPFWVSWVDRDG